MLCADRHYCGKGALLSKLATNFQSVVSPKVLVVVHVLTDDNIMSMN